MKYTLIITLAFVITLSAAAQIDLSEPPAADDSRWNVELRTGADRSTKKLGDADLSAGFGFDAACSYRFLPHLSAYAGWGWNTFNAERSFAGTDMDFEETGYAFGLQFIHPLGESAINYMIKAGGLYNHIEVENPNGNIIADSKHGMGWQIETGLVVPVSPSLCVVPSIRYRSLSRTITINSVVTDVELSYLSAGAGIVWSL